MEQNIQKITYFTYCGEANTAAVLQLARERAQELNVRKVVIASETGRSALKALDIFRGSDVQLVVVTHYPATTIGPKGQIPIGLKRPEYASRLKTLLENNVKIVQGTRPLAPHPRWSNHHRGWQRGDGGVEVNRKVTITRKMIVT